MELQPYFDHNSFANYHDGRPPSYWDWSGANGWPHEGRLEDPAAMCSWMEAQLVAKPDYVLVPSGDRLDAPYGRVLRARADYRIRERFRGGLFWRESVMQHFDFELYERVR